MTLDTGLDRTLYLDSHAAPAAEHKSSVDCPAAGVQQDGGAACQVPPVEEVIQQLAGTVRRALWRRRVAANDLDDVAQEVFIVVARKLPEFHVPVGMAAVEALAIWVCVICKYCARCYHRRRRPWLLRWRMDRHAADLPDTVDVVVTREQWDVLTAALAEVAPERRSVLVAHELEGKTIAEIAEEQSICEPTVSTRLRRGREELEAAVRRLSARRRAAAFPLLVLFLEERREGGERREGLWPWAVWGTIGLAMAATILLRGSGQWIAVPAGAAPAGRMVGEEVGVSTGVVGRGAGPAEVPAPPQGRASPLRASTASAARSASNERDTGDVSVRRERDERVYVEVARERLAAGRPDATRQVLRSHARAFPGGGYAGERQSLSARSKAVQRP